MRNTTVICLIILTFFSCKQEKKVFDDAHFLHLKPISSTVNVVNGDVIYAGWDTAIHIFNIDKRVRVFSRRLKDLCYMMPLLKNGLLYYPLSYGRFVCLRLSGKTPAWEIAISGRCNAAYFIDDKTLALDIENTGIEVIDAATGKKKYELLYDSKASGLPYTSPYPITSDEHRVYVGNWQGNAVNCFNKQNGTLLWEVSDPDGFGGTPVILGDKLFIGSNIKYKSGVVRIVDKRTGKSLTNYTCKYDPREPPIYYKGEVYFYTYDAAINKYNPGTGKFTRLATMSKDMDLMGSTWFLIDDKLMYSSNKWYIVSYSLSTNELITLQKTDRYLLDVTRYRGKIYLVN